MKPAECESGFVYAKEGQIPSYKDLRGRVTKAESRARSWNWRKRESRGQQEVYVDEVNCVGEWGPRYAGPDHPGQASTGVRLSSHSEAVAKSYSSY